MDEESATVQVLINGGITTDSKNDIERGIRKGPLDLRYDNEVRSGCTTKGSRKKDKTL